MAELINKQLIDSESIKEQSVKSLIGLEATVDELNTITKLNIGNGTGIESLAQKGCRASGNYSFAEGRSTKATGTYSHAEGWYTTASSSYSHAEGYSTTASKDSSHAEGNRTTANGRYSHAEGSSSETTGEGAHAEGRSTRAENFAAHAEGYYTISSGHGAHSEGGGTSATNYYAHAEGNQSEAFGSSSHAEGHYTQASGDSSHAEGGPSNSIEKIVGSWKIKNNLYYKADLETDIEFTSGPDNTVYTKLNVGYDIIDEDKKQIKLTYSNSSGSITVYANKIWLSEEYRTINIPEPPAHSSTSELLTWLQSNAHKQEALTYTTASGKNSHAEGSGTLAGGVGSHSEGVRTTASGHASHAQGADTKATADYAHAEGQGSLASGVGSHAENEWTVAGGTFSHAEGCFSVASAERAHAEGSHTDAAGKWSHTEGYYTKTLGSGSHAEGSSTIAKGDHSHSQGKDSYAYGELTFVSGVNTVAVNAHETVLGKFNIPTVSSSTINRTYVGEWRTGVEYKAPQCVKYKDNFYVCASKHTSGETFDESKWTLFSGKTPSANLLTIGNGTSDSNRSNAVTVDTNGNAWFSGNVTVGANNEILATQAEILATRAHVDTLIGDLYKALNDLQQALAQDFVFFSIKAIYDEFPLLCFKAAKGMTWEEWMNSEYTTPLNSNINIDFSVETYDGGTYGVCCSVAEIGQFFVLKNNFEVLPDEVISAGTTYFAGV